MWSGLYEGGTSLDTIETFSGEFEGACPSLFGVFYLAITVGGLCAKYWSVDRQ
jgi:hypothetical protein